MFCFVLFFKCKGGFPGGLDSKESACNAGNPGVIPGSGRSPGGHSNPLQCFCLDNPMNRGDWQVPGPWGCKVLDMTEQLTL